MGGSGEDATQSLEGAPDAAATGKEPVANQQPEPEPPAPKPTPAEERRRLLADIGKLRDSLVVSYVSRDSLTYEDAIQLYSELRQTTPTRNVDLFLESGGGSIDAAYKMIRICREHLPTGGRFGVIVPFFAKSAASLLALGADEIVMGPVSELGPIDPQVLYPGRTQAGMQYVPAQAVRDFLSYCRDFAKETQDLKIASAVLVPLIDKLDPWVVGDYERANKWAAQYARQLLSQGMLKQDPEQAAQTAQRMAEGYFSHGYVIDRKEASEELKLEVRFAQDKLWDLIWTLFLAYNEGFVKDNALTFVETSSHGAVKVERRSDQPARQPEAQQVQ